MLSACLLCCLQAEHKGIVVVVVVVAVEVGLEEEWLLRQDLEE